jgi:hypothetical protein
MKRGLLLTAAVEAIVDVLMDWLELRREGGGLCLFLPLHRPRLWTSLESLTPFSYLDAMLSTYEFLDRITNTLNTPPLDQSLKNRPFSAFAQA